MELGILFAIVILIAWFVTEQNENKRREREAHKSVEMPPMDEAEIRRYEYVRWYQNKYHKPPPSDDKRAWILFWN